MKPITKRAAFTTLLSTILCSNAAFGQENKGWKWPSRTTSQITQPVAWDQVPTANQAVQPAGIYGSSDFSAFPTPHKTSATTASVAEVPWEVVVAKNLPKSMTQDRKSMPPNGAQQIPWQASKGQVAPSAAQAPVGLIGAADSIPWFQVAPEPIAASVAATITPPPAIAPPAARSTGALPTVVPPPAVRSTSTPSKATPPVTSSPEASYAAGMIGPSDIVPSLVPPESVHVAQLPWSAADVSSATPATNSPATTMPPATTPATMSLAAVTPAAPAVNLLPLSRTTETAASPVAAESEPVTAPQQNGQAYILQNVRAPQPKQQTAQTETLIPIDILPLNRLVSTDTEKSAKAQRYSTATMIAPLTDASFLFAKLNIEGDYRHAPALPVSQERGWMGTNYAWVTPTFYHHPLYFEQVNMERYGNSPKHPVFFSAAHFYTSILVMPYKLLAQHPCEKVYTLGHRRPGDCVPFQGRSLLGQSYPGEALRYFDSCSGYR
ncbi:MAG: hypothetical protein R3C53_25315 [Pirellulaceae bacterium]